MTLLTENVCPTPDTAILEPDLPPQKGPRQKAAPLKGIRHKKTPDPLLKTPLDPGSSISHQYEGDN